MLRILRDWLPCAALAVCLTLLSGCVVREKERPVVVHERDERPVVVHEKEVVRDPPVTERRITTERETVRHD